ncbi:hypothetical protein [Micromonospora qiuiae]|nr:hypothetical protein [Micromonospora qiuiae]
MSTRRLGRLLGSLLLVGSLVVVAGVATEPQFRTNGIEWQMPATDLVVR